MYDARAYKAVAILKRLICFACCNNIGQRDCVTFPELLKLFSIAQTAVSLITRKSVFPLVLEPLLSNKMNGFSLQ